jgi:hypothetical protein
MHALIENTRKRKKQSSHCSDTERLGRFIMCIQRKPPITVNRDGAGRVSEFQIIIQDCQHPQNVKYS